MKTSLTLVSSRIERRNLATRPTWTQLRQFYRHLALHGLDNIDWRGHSALYVACASQALEEGLSLEVAHRRASAVAYAPQQKPTLVYKSTGKPVQVGDRIKLSDGRTVEVTFFREPHKPASQGKVSVMTVGKKWMDEYYVSVIGAEWINRIDR